MPYDEALVERLRELLAHERAITERAMFGGLAFLLHGNMSVTASGSGRLMVRVDPADTDDLAARPHVASMRMRGRPMDGWITVHPEGLQTPAELADWVSRSIAFVRALPPKPPVDRPGS